MGKSPLVKACAGPPFSLPESGVSGTRQASARTTKASASLRIAALARSVEYGTGLVVSAQGHIVTDLRLTQGCQVIVAAGLGVAIVPAPRAGTLEAAAGPLAYCEILDAGAVRDLTLTWSAERRLLPAAELFRRHVIRSASAGQVPALSDGLQHRLRGLSADSRNVGVLAKH